MSRFRWIADPAADGFANMAFDEALLTRVGSGESPPTLRFYRWSPPTISLGYFQEYAAYDALPPPAGDLAVVRRQTGGGAILHDLELTYSMVLPVEHPLVAGNANALYEHVHQAVAELLIRLGVPVARGPAGGGACSHHGPFFCFERHACIDLLAGGRKLMGSAQRRTRHAVLQHGSLILDSRFPQQACATVSQFTGFELETILFELAAALVGSDPGHPGQFDDAELELAGKLREKYASSAWTRRR